MEKNPSEEKEYIILLLLLKILLGKPNGTKL